MAKILEPNSIDGISFWSIFLKNILSKSGKKSGNLVGFKFYSNQIISVQLFIKWKLVSIDSKYIRNWENLTKSKSLILNIDPIHTIIGLQVYDQDGKNLGRVCSIEQIGFYNDFESFKYKKKFYLPSKKIYKNQILTIKKNIILKVSV